MKTSKRNQAKRGFTLVELLVVIGIIALLISILLPSLTAVRRSAMSLKCLANERTIGQAMLMYGSANKGTLLPSMVWSGTTNVDYWPFILVTGRYLPDPHIIARDGSAAQNTVFVCPSVRDAMVVDEANGTGATISMADGFERRYSRVLAPQTMVPPPEPVNNGANSKGAMIIDIGYGINGNSVSGQPVACKNVPFQAISVPTSGFPPLRKYTQFRYPTKTVMLFDGTAWNPWNNPWRITGARHGNYNKDRQYTSGTCNILFMDGHAESILRSDLPTTGTQITGTAAEMLNNKYYWNVLHQ